MSRTIMVALLLAGFCPLAAPAQKAPKPPKPVYVAKVNIKDLAHGGAIKEKTTNDFLLVFSDGRAWSSLLTEAQIFAAFGPLFADEWTVSDLVVTNTLLDVVAGFGAPRVTATLVAGVPAADGQTAWTYQASPTVTVTLTLPAVFGPPPTNSTLRIEVDYENSE